MQDTERSRSGLKLNKGLIFLEYVGKSNVSSVGFKFGPPFDPRGPLRVRGPRLARLLLVRDP